METSQLCCTYQKPLKLYIFTALIGDQLKYSTRIFVIPGNNAHVTNLFHLP